jgi:hypothetical protein
VTHHARNVRPFRQQREHVGDVEGWVVRIERLIDRRDEREVDGLVDDPAQLRQVGRLGEIAPAKALGVMIDERRGVAKNAGADPSTMRDFHTISTGWAGLAAASTFGANLRSGFGPPLTKHISID